MSGKPDIHSAQRKKKKKKNKDPALQSSDVEHAVVSHNAEQL